MISFKKKQVKYLIFRDFLHNKHSSGNSWCFPNKQEMLRLLKDDVIVDIFQKMGPVLMSEQEYQIQAGEWAQHKN